MRARELGEDVSLCHRWRALGGEVHALIEGADVGHVGTFEFAGSFLRAARARGQIGAASFGGRDGEDGATARSTT